MPLTPDRVHRDGLPPKHIAGLYLLFGIFMLFVSDVVLLVLFEDPLLRVLQGLKGLIEVALTAAFVYLLVSWSWQDIRRHRRATDTAPIGITLTDPDREDNPLVFANERFQQLTGYDGEEILGRNCRFMQGPETSEEARRQMQEAIEAERPVSVDVVNYGKSGEKFWNKVDVAPVRDDAGEVANFVGFQSDITERKLREERLRVLNRILRHNFRNKMTVIDGHATMLGEEFDEPPESVTAIQRAVDDLRSLTERVRENEAVLQAAAESRTSLALEEPLEDLVADARERHPDASIEVSLPGPVTVRAAGLVWAVGEAVENAIEHNDSAEPWARVAVAVTDDDWVQIDVVDDGPGIPTEEVEVLSEGETPLKHGNRLGLWSIHWIVNLAGGSLSIEDAETGGTRLRLTVPGGRGAEAGTARP